MASLAAPVAAPGGPSFFQSWALRLSEGVNAGVSSPNVSPSCIDHIARTPVPERSDLKHAYFASPPDVSKDNVYSSHRQLNTSSDESSEDAGQATCFRNAAESLHQQRTRSRTSSNGSKVSRFFRSSVGSKGAKEDLLLSEGPSVAEVGQTVKKKSQGRRASLFASLQSGTTEKSVSNPTCEHSQPPLRRSPGAEVERTAKKKDRHRSSIFSPFHGATINKSDPITQVQDSQPPRVTIVKVSPSDEIQAFEPSSSYTKTRLRSKGDSRRSSGVEELYDRSKRFLKRIGRRTSSEPASDPIDPRPTTKVSELLGRVNSVLVHQTRNNTLRSPTPESSHVVSPQSTPLPHKPARSSSSSVRNLMMGKPPLNTPDSTALYGGPDDREFFKVDISNPDGPTFLPSEARRIGTPPLPSEGPRGRRRGFFFDLNAPNANANAIADSSPSDDDEPSTPHASAELMTPRARLFAAARRRSAGHNDWFSVQLMVEDALEAEEQFELNVPEHLLGSPLCPRSPMHKSGGNGVCVYHGRNKPFPLR